MAIEGVVYEKREPDHVDQRRTLSSLFNGDLGTFVAKQIKFADVKEDSVLGGHYHLYRELFCVLEGEIIFELEDIMSKEKRKCPLTPGHRLLIPPNVAHRATAKGNTLLVGCTEEPYISSEHNDHKYNLSD